MRAREEAHISEGDLEAKLNLPWGAGDGGGLELAEEGRSQGIDWGAEIGAIEDIEKVRVKVDPESFGEGEAAGERHVVDHEGWGAERIAADGSERIGDVGGDDEEIPGIRLRQEPLAFVQVCRLAQSAERGTRGEGGPIVERAVVIYVLP